MALTLSTVKAQSNLQTANKTAKRKDCCNWLCVCSCSMQFGGVFPPEVRRLGPHGGRKAKDIVKEATERIFNSHVSSLLLQLLEDQSPSVDKVGEQLEQFGKSSSLNCERRRKGNVMIRTFRSTFRMLNEFKLCWL